MGSCLIVSLGDTEPGTSSSSVLVTSLSKISHSYKTSSITLDYRTSEKMYDKENKCWAPCFPNFLAKNTYWYTIKIMFLGTPGVHVLEVNSALPLRIQRPLVPTRGVAGGFQWGKSLPSWLSQHLRMIPGQHWVFVTLRVLAKHRIQICPDYRLIIYGLSFLVFFYVNKIARGRLFFYPISKYCLYFTSNAIFIFFMVFPSSSLNIFIQIRLKLLDDLIYIPPKSDKF